ncbi:hypothetical protein D3C72_2141340 [compost metagenome]
MARAGGDHDHFLLGQGQAVGFTLHQRVVPGEEGAELLGAVRQHEEHVGNEAGAVLHGKDALAQVGRQGVERFGYGETADRGGHERLLILCLKAPTLLRGHRAAFPPSAGTLVARRFSAGQSPAPPR